MDQSRPSALNQDTLKMGISYLTSIDLDLKKIVDDIGNPPLWSRKPGFSTLIHIILEQQVSLASARATFNKLMQASSELNPEVFLSFSDSQLKDFGFSWQKTNYGRALAQAMLNGTLDLNNLQNLSDEEAKNALMQVKGIGHWTADIYLLMALLRPDIWPAGDLALAKALQKIKHLEQQPDTNLLAEIAEGWQPWRAVAARIVWHYYLNT